MFSLFKKKQAQSELPLKKKIKDMKCRKINYVDEVNYYAIKSKYIMGKVYTSEDYQENYVQFFRYEYDHECGKTDIYPLSAELMSKALAKVGIIIDLKALAKDQ